MAQHVGMVRNGDEFASRIVSGLLEATVELNQPHIENLSGNALRGAGMQDIVDVHEARHKAVRMLGMKADFLSTMTSAQKKNQAIRFGLEEGSTSVFQKSFPLKTNFFGGSASATDGQDYEDVVSKEILDAPVADICVVQKGDQVPNGFYRLSKTPGNKVANVNSNSGGNHIFICIKKDVARSGLPITALVVIFPDKGECVPPGFFVVRRGQHACNLNTGTSAERVFLCYKKDKVGNPIVDLQVIFTGKNEENPKNFSIIDKSPTGLDANLNSGTNGIKVFLSYKLSLNRLNCLLNETIHSPRERKIQSQPRSASKSILPGVSMAARSKSGGDASSPAKKLLKESASADKGTTTADEDEEDSILRANTAANTGAARTRSGSQHDKEGNSNASGKVRKGILRSTSTREDDEFEAERMEAEGLMEEEGYEDIDEQEEREEGTEDEPVTKFDSRVIHMVVDADGNPLPKTTRMTLYAIVATLYVRHGNLAMKTIRDMVVLLQNTDFFDSDLKGPPPANAITKIEIMVDAICDRLDLCIEGEIDLIVVFLNILIKHSGGQLSLSVLQRIFRALSFLYNYRCASKEWMKERNMMPVDRKGGTLPAFDCMRKLLRLLVAQVETVDVATRLPDMLAEVVDYTGQSEAFQIVHSNIVDLVDEVTDSVELNRICEESHLAIAKQSHSASSFTFWRTIGVLSRKLFVEAQQRNAYIALCATCKLAWPSLRANDKGTVSSRDLGVKLLALECLREFLAAAGEHMTESRLFGYQIRRLVVPCVLNNLSSGLTDHRMFSKLLSIVSALWMVWRVHVRIEIAVLCEKFIIRILQASPIQARPNFQMIALKEVVSWFDQPHLLLEMFVNFDLDAKFVSHWNCFSHLIRSVCAIAKRAAIVTSAWDVKTGNSVADESFADVSVRDVNIQAIEEVARVAKTLMDASGHAYLIIQDSSFRSRSLMIGAGWEEANKEGILITEDGEGDETAANRGDSFDEDASMLKEAYRLSLGSLADHTKRTNTCTKRTIHQDAEEKLKEAVKIYTAKGSLTKAINYLVKAGFMANSPQEVANFLRVYKSSFDPSAIGDYLGNGGENPAEEEYFAQLRFRYTRAVFFVEMELEPALRMYLTSCGFRMPGEAQKIDRFVEVFTKVFWQDNSGTPYCPFRHPDTVHLLTYATIILNTDLHRANNDKKAKNKKMTKEQFFNNLRGSDQGQNIDQLYLSRIYDNIQAQPIELALDSSELQGADSGSGAPDGGSHAHGTATLALGALVSIGSRGHTGEGEFSPAEERLFIKQLSVNIRDAEDLLRSLSGFVYPFQLTGVDAKISLDLVSYMFDCVWVHFRDITEALLSMYTQGASTVDWSVIVSALDVLSYAMTAAIFLNAKSEKMVFANQLLLFQQALQKTNVNPNNVALEDMMWFAILESSPYESAMDTISQIHILIQVLKDAVNESENYEITRQVATKIEKKARILENNTYFVREGDLGKKANRSGRIDTYRFFLFSDTLLYCHHGMTGEYKVHEQMSMIEMEVSDWDDQTNEACFYLQHPVKSFVVVCDSQETKMNWMRDLRQGTASCIKRRDEANERRRLSFLDRIDDQQKQQNEKHERRMSVKKPKARDSVNDSPYTPPLFDPLAASADEEDAEILARIASPAKAAIQVPSKPLPSPLPIHVLPPPTMPPPTPADAPTIVPEMPEKAPPSPSASPSPQANPNPNPNPNPIDPIEEDKDKSSTSTSRASMSISPSRHESNELIPSPEDRRQSSDFRKIGSRTSSSSEDLQKEGRKSMRFPIGVTFVPKGSRSPSASPITVPSGSRRHTGSSRMSSPSPSPSTVPETAEKRQSEGFVPIQSPEEAQNAEAAVELAPSLVDLRPKSKRKAPKAEKQAAVPLEEAFMATAPTPALVAASPSADGVETSQSGSEDKEKSLVQESAIEVVKDSIATFETGPAPAPVPQLTTQDEPMPVDLRPKSKRKAPKVEQQAAVPIEEAFLASASASTLPQGESPQQPESDPSSLSILTTEEEAVSVSVDTPSPPADDSITVGKDSTPSSPIYNALTPSTSTSSFSGNETISPKKEAISAFKKPLPSPKVTVTASSESVPESVLAAPEAVKAFSERLASVGSKALSSMFFAGAIYWKNMQEKRAAVNIPLDIKLRLHGTYKQAKLGPAPMPSEEAQHTHVADAGTNFSINGGLVVNSSKPFTVNPRLKRDAGTAPLSGASGKDEGSPASGNGRSPKPFSKGSETAEITSEKQLEAWRACGDMSHEDAIREYMIALYTVAPNWKFNHYM